MRKTTLHSGELGTLIGERNETHGNFLSNSYTSQAIKQIYNESQDHTKPLDAYQREALDMIAHKIGRIFAGDADFLDHWLDIAGYATLVHRQLMRAREMMLLEASAQKKTGK